MEITASSTIIFNAVFLATGTLFIAIRLFTVKRTRSRSIHNSNKGRSFAAIASDILLIGAWVFLALGATCGFWKAARQLQRMRDRDDDRVLDGMGLRKGDLGFGMKMIVAETMSFILSLWLVKGAMVAMLVFKIDSNSSNFSDSRNRIYDIRQYLSRGLQRLLYFTTFFTISAIVSILLSSFLTCRPFTRNWWVFLSRFPSVDTSNGCIRKVGNEFCSAVNSSTLIALAAITIVNDILSRFTVYFKSRQISNIVI